MKFKTLKNRKISIQFFSKNSIQIRWSYSLSQFWNSLLKSLNCCMLPRVFTSKQLGIEEHSIRSSSIPSFCGFYELIFRYFNLFSIEYKKFALFHIIVQQSLKHLFKFWKFFKNEKLGQILNFIFVRHSFEWY